MTLNDFFPLLIGVAGSAFYISLKFLVPMGNSTKTEIMRKEAERCLGKGCETDGTPNAGFPFCSIGFAIERRNGKDRMVKTSKPVFIIH